MLGVMPSAPKKLPPAQSPAFNVLCSVLRPYAGCPLCSQACRGELVLTAIFYLSRPLCSLYVLNLLAAEKFFFVILLYCSPASAGVTSLFWKGLLHIRTLMLQPSILRTLVLGWFCWLYWIPSDLAERPHFITREGFFPQERKKPFLMRPLLRSTASGKVVLPYLPLMPPKPKWYSSFKNHRG